MLFALLYNEENEIIAAAPACEQLPMGDAFWAQCHLAGFDIHANTEKQFQTAYVCVTNPLLQRQLQWVGIDETIDPRELTNAVEGSLVPDYVSRNAA